MFLTLNGDHSVLGKKRTQPLPCDAFLGEPYFRFFEYDEFQHFSSHRMKTLEMYPDNLPLGIDKEYYMYLCSLHSVEADLYRSNKTTREFNFPEEESRKGLFLTR